MNLSRRTALQLVLGGAGVSVLAACGVSSAPGQPTATMTPAPSGPAAATPIPTTAAAATLTAAPPATATGGPAAAASAPTTTAAAAGQPKSGGRLLYGLSTDLSRLDPHFKTPEAYNTIWNAYDRLTENDFELKQHPQLAESWDINANFTEIKFNLRHGVQFHSGREMTSDDVKWNLERGKDPKVAAGAFLQQANWWSSVEVPDKYTVILKSDVPRPAMFDHFEFLCIADKATIDDPTKAIGTGPFILKEWAQNDHYLFARNPNYWVSGQPYFDEFEVRILRDQVTMATQFEAGRFDVIFNPSLLEYARLSKDPQFRGLPHPGKSRFYTVGANVQRPPLDNKLVRQALLLHAIDRKRFVDTFLSGLGVPQTLFWPDYSLAYEASKQLTEFNLDKARSLLEQAGVASGFELDFLPNRPDDVEIRGFGQMYQADLAKLNVKLNVVNLESAAFFDQVNNRKFTGLYQASGTVAGEPATTLASSRGFDPATNNSGFNNERYTQLIAQASAEPDAAKRTQMYAELNDIFLDAAFYVSLSPLTLSILTSSRVQGVRPLNHDAFEIKGAWFA